MSTDTAVGTMPTGVGIRMHRACYKHHARMASCPDCNQPRRP